MYHLGEDWENRVIQQPMSRSRQGQRSEAVTAGFISLRNLEKKKTFVVTYLYGQDPRLFDRTIYMTMRLVANLGATGQGEGEGYGAEGGPFTNQFWEGS